MSTQPTGSSAPPIDRTDFAEPLTAWPALDRVAWSRWCAKLEATCAAVLQGRQPDALSAIDAGDAWVAGIAAFTTGTGPLLGHWVERNRLAVTPPLAAVFRAHLDQSRLRHQRLAAEAARVTTAFAAAGITTVLLKGLHTAMWLPEPAARACTDIDLLVAPRDRPAAEATLAQLGFRAGAIVSGQRCTWLPPGEPRLHSLELTHEHNPWSVDLHWTLTRTRFRALHSRLPDVEPADCPAWSAFGVAARVLPVAVQVPYLAIHAAERLPLIQLVRLYELALVIRAEAASGALSWSAVDAVLTASDARHFAYPALRLVERLAPGTVDAGFLRTLEGATPERLVRVVATVPVAGDPDPARWALSEPFLWTRGAGEWLHVLWRQLWPGADYGSPRAIAGFYGRRISRLVRRQVKLRPVPVR